MYYICGFTKEFIAWQLMHYRLCVKFGAKWRSYGRLTDLFRYILA